VAGDYWTFLAGEPPEHPRRLWVVLNDSTPGEADPFGPAHSFIHAIPDRFGELTPFEIPFSQFWRRDNIIDDRDRVRATWGAWYSAGSQGANNIIISDRETTEVISGDTFYTQTQVAWDFATDATAFGAWVGIDTGRCSSYGRSTLNFLIKPVVAGAGSLTLRIKVKDAQGYYFYSGLQRHRQRLAAGVGVSGGDAAGIGIGLHGPPPPGGGHRHRLLAPHQRRFLYYGHQV
jgi:hypothetical protein